MSMDGAQLVFGELIKRHGRVEVPMIQRDYAQGRADQEEVRSEFLHALYKALCLPPESDLLPLNLDFVYGSVGDQEPSCFQPLDGQQRLTTLFLLHWYLAWLDSCGEEFREQFLEEFQDGAHSRFNYQVRPSSSEFFDALAAFSPATSPTAIKKISEFIQDQPWYFRNWRLDPTIQSGLVMLDAMHSLFSSTQGLYARITDTEQPAITFQLLDLKDFGLSDDLYIKMNARGKPLTTFETFKARFEQSLRELFPDETRELNGQPVSLDEFFSRRMDTRWSDFFWPYRDADNHLFDGAVMNVFRAILLTTRDAESDEFNDDITKLRSRFSKSSYALFTQKDWLDRPFSERLITLLETWSGSPGSFNQQLPDSRYFDEQSIFEKACQDPEGLGYDELIQFTAYGQFLEYHAEDIDAESFQAWMRVVFNLTVNTDYNRPADMQRSLESIRDLTPHMANICEYLASEDAVVKGFSREQVTEELIKARLLLSHGDWQSLLERGENHGYFRGQIGFLLKFAGLDFDLPFPETKAWSSDKNRGLQGLFSEYLSKATTMFDRSGLSTLPDFLWERSLLSIGDYLLPARRNYSLLVNLRTDQASWKRLLRGAIHDSKQSAVLRALWEDLDSDDDISSQLLDVISNASVSDPWRLALIKEPAAISYCRNRMIRFGDHGKVYLLKRTQMNGSHAELFSYCFFTKVLSPNVEDAQLNFLKAKYSETATADEEPSVILSFASGNTIVKIFIEYSAGDYQFSIDEGDGLSGELEDILLKHDFQKGEECYIRPCSLDEAEAFIYSLDDEIVGLAKE